TSEKLDKCKAEFIAEVQKLRITDKGVWCDAPIFFAKAFK
ncbi:methyltransferase type 11, partial [Brunnivagina elsteri CCALA 953]